jgi:uncharacterized protein YxeA
MKNILFAVTISFFFIATEGCKKKNQEPDNRNTYLKKEIFSTGSVEYTYNAQSKLVRWDYTDNTNAANNYSITISKYSAEGLIEETLADYSGTSSDRKSVYTYNADGTISKSSVYRLTTTGEALQSEFLYSYNNGRVLNSVRNVATGEIIPKQETWINIDGNISQVKYYNVAGTLVETRDYTSYDKKRSPYKLIPAALAGINSKLNPLSYVRTITSTGETTNISFTYEYNEDGYPIKRISNNGGISTYEYIKQ